MRDVSKLCARLNKPLLIFLMASGVLAAWSGRHKNSPSSSAVSFGHWGIPRLAVFLSDKGLALRLVPTQKDGEIDWSAYLTTTGKQWDDMNHLCMDPTRINEWQGTLCCEWHPTGDELACLGEHGLIIGPFLFYGDSNLLARVRDALTPLVTGEPVADVARSPGFARSSLDDKAKRGMHKARSPR